MTDPTPPPEPTEEELRAFEEQLKRVRVEDVIVQTVVSLINLAGRKAGLVPGSESEKDLEQVRMAIESVRTLLPQVEAGLGPDAAQIRDALSQLQMTYAQQAGPTPAGTPPEGPGPAPAAEPAPPAQPPPSRLWVPGQ